MTFSKLCLVTLTIALFAVSCQKDEPETPNLSPEEQAIAEAQEFLQASALMESIFNSADEESRQQPDLNGFQGEGPEVAPRNNCPVVTVTTTPQTIFPAVMTLDYGPGCTAAGGIQRSGQVIVTFDGLLFQEGQTFTIDLVNYTENDNAVAGRFIATNLGEDASGFPTISTSIENGQVAFANGNTFSYDSQVIRKLVEGKDTNFFTDGLAGIFDDVWTYEGTASGVSNGNNYQFTTPNPVREPLDCVWPTAGNLALSLPGFNFDVDLDYGNGDCDNVATLTAGTFSTQIQL
ncbi:MAG: hypothetical protein AAF597_19360 [Bacteroidota bacterium]